MKSSIHDERISSYLDDALPEAERVAFQTQLAHDPTLQQHVSDLQQLRRDVATLPRFSVKEGFAQRVVAAALAAKAHEAKANETKVAPAQRPSTTRRLIVAALAVAASAAFVMASLPWLHRGDEPLANNGNPVVAQETNPLSAVVAALPSDDETLILRIRSPKDLAAGKLLREAFAQQGIEKRRPSDTTVRGPAVGNAYRNQLRNDTTIDRSQLTTAADALYVEMSAEELELALSEVAKPNEKVEFHPAGLLAVAASTTGGKGVQGAGESEAVKGGQATSQEFIQELSPSLFRLQKTPVQPSSTNKTAKEVAPGRKVRVLILIENAE
ncbi:hypothetical protein ETAA8_38820 [Anatilimnocola aggregata]|uniref:Uncharacterized protein n=1 Tax=Anatilimnocola aggregata TaxID=2528021 RepID=A0A517YEX2_9BACT|nr:hypothetical protein [Anatilimnocola aggregata]QDU28777.1 hypothetical protein ETAA8_38820 [Anatilimnocola aggregata]